MAPYPRPPCASCSRRRRPPTCATLWRRGSGTGKGQAGGGGESAERRRAPIRKRERSKLSSPALPLFSFIPRQNDADAFYSDDDTDLRGFWSDGEDSGGIGGPAPAARGGRARKAGGKPPRAPRAAKTGGGAPGGGHNPPPLRSHLVSSGAGVAQVIRRRAARASDPDALYALRVPRPLPLSWGRTVAPYVGRDAVAAADAVAVAAGQGGGGGAAAAATAAAFVAAPAGDVRALLASPPPTGPLAPGARTWQALLVNCGWEAGVGGGGDTAAAAAAAGGPCGARGGAPPDVPSPSTALAAFASLPIPALLPSGYLFAWVRKEHIAPVTAQMYAWGFYYVESLAWVWVGLDGDVLALPAPVTGRAHATLMIYRKGAEEVELRHQRSPDVVFDCVVGGGGGGGGPVAVPPEAYSAIETMLPQAAGKRLELWAAPPGRQRAAGARGVGGGRAGWTHVYAAGE